MKTIEQHKAEAAKRARNAKFKGFLLIAVVLGCFVGLGYFLSYFPGFEYSNGERTGTVYKISEAGYVFKTFEGELSLGLNERDAGGAVIARIFHFSVNDPEVIKKIQDADRSGERVTLIYKEYKWRSPIYGNSNYNIVDVLYQQEHRPQHKE